MLFTSTVLTLAAYYKGLAPTSASAWGSAITTRAFHSTPRLSGLTGALSGGFSTQFDNVINKDTMRMKYTHYLYHTHIIYHINKNVAYKVWGSQYIIYAQFVAIKNYDKPFGVQTPSFIQHSRLLRPSCCGSNKRHLSWSFASGWPMWCSKGVHKGIRPT